MPAGASATPLPAREHSGNYLIDHRGPTTKDGLPSNYIRAVAVDRNGDVWVATWKGLARLNRLINGAFTVYHKSDGLVEDDVRFVTGDPDGGLWIGTTGGMSRFRDGKLINYTVANGFPFPRLPEFTISQ